MIVRKPYAFLIKNFRLIHGILFIILLYLAIKSFNIYNFFNDYAVNHYFVNSATLISDYVNAFIYISIFLVIAISVVVYYLLSVKQKSRGFYLLLIIYYVILIVYFIYISSVFKRLQTGVLSVETVRALRDIGLIIMIPQVIFLVMSVVRMLGFNLKKFEFKKDLEDLQIETTDYEEVEVTLGKNNYKYKRFIRKVIRYLGYFFQENKFFVTALGSIIVLALSIILYLNVRVYNVKYEVNQVIYANTMWYTVKNSYVTNKDVSGKIIDSRKYYVIVETQIDNKSNKKYDLSSELFRLDIGEKSISPRFNIDKEFIDFGKIYSPMSINMGEVLDVFVTFEIDKNDLKNEYLFKISNVENMNPNAVKDQFKDVIIIPKNLDEVIEGKNYYVGNDITFENTSLGNTTFKINSYKVASIFKDKYNYCYNNKCYDKEFNIKPSNTDKYVIIKLEYDLNVDENIYMKNYLKNASNLLEYFATIKYRLLGNNYEEKIRSIQVEYEKPNVSYIEVPKDVLNANKLEISLNIRGKISSIILK